MYRWIHRVWYEDSKAFVLLLPFALVFRFLQACRTVLYRIGILRCIDVGVPVIVVGNITAGGTGKTPTAIWLANELAARGFRPGVVSRGYGRSRGSGTTEVGPDSDPAIVGDEPVVLARRGGCPVAVDSDRVRAAEWLTARGCDVVIADDGLQHYRLARHYEICVIDAARGLGNGWPLPAGPLREPETRLDSVDQVLLNRSSSRERHADRPTWPNETVFELVADEARRVNGTGTQPLATLKGRRVHAVAAIGNPERFFDLLRTNGLEVIGHAYPDHAPLRPEDFAFGDDFAILVTEKDAVKLTRADDRIWYVPVNLEITSSDAERILDDIQARARAHPAKT